MRPPKVALTSHQNARLVTGTTPEKRMQSARLLAQSAGRSLIRVDLSAVVSKYIGETEKRIDRLLDEAERSGSILLFDEADALFGKRTEVKDSHDRYANLQTAFELAARDRGVAVLIGTSLSRSSLAESQAALPLQRHRKWPP
ncbi:MAG TPA: AAA family ATPase [Povalibacter sp.]